MDQIANPYWDAIAGYVVTDRGHPEIPTVSRADEFRNPDGSLDVAAFYANVPQQGAHTRRYSWTVTDPGTVAFVVAHAGPAVIDPLAGTGYWAWLLAQHGVEVAAYDANPPALGSDANEWHRDVACWVPVAPADATHAVQVYADRTLLLSWPPLDSPIARQVLAAYAGGRVIYIGDDRHGNCADDQFFDLLERGWVRVADHVPVRWRGEHDLVAVYERAG